MILAISLILNTILFFVAYYIYELFDKNNIKFKIARKRLERYSKIVNIEDIVEKLQKDAEILKTSINSDQGIHNELKNKIILYSTENNLISYGFYEPQYNLSESSHYTERLSIIRKRQKKLICNKKAILIDPKLELELQEELSKLALSSFNVQCDNTILKVNYKNILKLEERLKNIKNSIDILLPQGCKIEDYFFDMKLDELHLVYEYEEKKNQEKEEQREIKKQMVEEERERREIEKEKNKAEKEEQTYKAALHKAKQELLSKNEHEKELYLEKIRLLEERVLEAESNTERAKSLAQSTKKGHIYVISNIGSFGENVFKIGMTRRLMPLDRVKELGDASVPFSFDVHALISSENAPVLEKKLHDLFSNKRLNRVNFRKEFFNITLQEIEQKCAQINVSVEFTKIAEAEEYRKTLSIVEKENEFSNKNLKKIA